MILTIPSIQICFFAIHKRLVTLPMSPLINNPQKQNIPFSPEILHEMKTMVIRRNPQRMPFDNCKEAALTKKMKFLPHLASIPFQHRGEAPPHNSKQPLSNTHVALQRPSSPSILESRTERGIIKKRDYLKICLPAVNSPPQLLGVL